MNSRQQKYLKSRAVQYNISYVQAHQRFGLDVQFPALYQTAIRMKDNSSKLGGAQPMAAWPPFVSHKRLSQWRFGISS